jgi:nickel-dependent lactate racemase
MRVDLPYGRGVLVAEVPDDAVVVSPADLPGLADQQAAVADALSAPWSGPPLAELVGPTDRVVVVFPDITRPMPNRTVLPPLLEQLELAGAGPDRVDLLCATGTHRPASPAELAELVGDDVVGRYRVHQHRADGDEHVEVGRVDGVAVRLDARYVAADVRICTGFVEPHFFAGFSGGPKGVCPGLADTATVLEAHSPARIADPRSTWLRVDGNPVHDFVRAAVDLSPPNLCLDVAINRRRQLTAVFAGPLPGAHRAACDLVERTAVARLDRPFEVVVATNAGYPLDRNLYQAVKGMAAAARVVADGGTVVMAAACADGVPESGGFARLLASAGGLDELAGPGGQAEPDRWQAQVMGRVLRRAQVWLHAEGLSDDQVRSAHLRPVDDVSAAVAEALAAAGPAARCCVLPQGPLTVAGIGAADP